MRRGVVCDMVEITLSHIPRTSSKMSGKRNPWGVGNVDLALSDIAYSLVQIARSPMSGHVPSRTGIAD